MKNPLCHVCRNFAAILAGLAFALGGTVAAPAATYTWTATNGTPVAWTNGGNWSGGVAPDPVAGDTVDFSTVNILSNMVLSLDANRTAEVWKFADKSGSQIWTINAGSQLILAGAAPTIQVSNNTTTLNCVLAGTSGFTKTGGGTLALTGSNTFGNVTLNGGVLQFTTLSAGMSGTGKNFSFTGNSTLTAPDNYTAGQISVNNGVTATISGNTITFASATGLGNITFGGGDRILTLGNAGTFYGNLRTTAGGNSTHTIQFTALGDAVGAGNLQFAGGTGDSNQRTTIRLYNNVGPLTLNYRRIEFIPKPNNWSFRDAILENNNASAINKFVINTPLLNNQDRDHNFELGGKQRRQQ